MLSLRVLASSLAAVTLLACGDIANLPIPGTTGPSPSNPISPGRSDAGPPPQVDPAPAPNPPPSACAMTKRDNLVCVTCTDETGRVVRQDCHDPGGQPNQARCEEFKQRDGTVCVVCKDPNGNEIKRGCSTPPSSGCGEPPKPQPPMPVDAGAPSAGACFEQVENGLRCKVCVDGNKREVGRWCEPAPPMPPAPTSPITCVETSFADGTTCTVCTDAKGEVIKRGCSMPAPQPTTPSMITCKDYEVDGKRCSECVDSTGKIVRQSCAPANTPPKPEITCRRYAKPGSVCVICTDETGKVVKQDCQNVVQ